MDGSAAQGAAATWPADDGRRGEMSETDGGGRRTDGRRAGGAYASRVQVPVTAVMI